MGLAEVFSFPASFEGGRGALLSVPLEMEGSASQDYGVLNGRDYKLIGFMPKAARGPGQGG